MIAGATNAGKTTMLRALANEIAPSERLITVERALELGLGEYTDLHPNVVAFEERLPNSEGLGGVTMAELVRRSLRMNPSRVIVGEVLGDEIVTMLNAMSQGNDGSLSTIHANSSLEVFNRIGTYAIQSRERLPLEATNMLIAGALDFVIFLRKRNDHETGGTQTRVVESVREVVGNDGQVLSSEVFAPGADGRAAAHAPAVVRRGAGRARLLTRRARAVGLMLEQFRIVLAASAGALVGLGCVLFVVGLRPGPARATRPAPAAAAVAARRPGAGGGCCSRVC